jgi:hypothetical protein
MLQEEPVSALTPIKPINNITISVIFTRIEICLHYQFKSQSINQLRVKPFKNLWQKTTLLFN